MAAIAQAQSCANDDEPRKTRDVYLPPLPTMGPVDRLFLSLFWGARFPVLVAPATPEHA
jgi:hypothetical protein